MMSQLKEFFREKTTWVIIVVLALFVVLVTVGYFFLFSGSGTKAADLGQLGDYFGGTLNPFFGLFTTVFAFFAYKNTEKQLDFYRDEKSENRLQQNLQNYENDLNLIISNLVFKQQDGTVFEGASALKKYKDFLQECSLVINNPSVPGEGYGRLDFYTAGTYEVIYLEIYRVKLLIEHYKNTIGSGKNAIEHLELFLEKVRLTLPFSIISCMDSMIFINSRKAQTNDGFQIWFEETNLSKYRYNGT